MRGRRPLPQHNYAFNQVRTLKEGPWHASNDVKNVAECHLENKCAFRTFILLTAKANLTASENCALSLRSYLYVVQTGEQ